MHATEVFARYAAEFYRQPLPAEVIHHAKRAVIDWYASLFPGQHAHRCRIQAREKRCWSKPWATTSIAVAPSWRKGARPLRALLRSSTARLRMPQR